MAGGGEGETIRIEYSLWSVVNRQVVSMGRRRMGVVGEVYVRLLIRIGEKRSEQAGCSPTDWGNFVVGKTARGVR